LLPIATWAIFQLSCLGKYDRQIWHTYHIYRGILHVFPWDVTRPIKLSIIVLRYSHPTYNGHPLIAYYLYMCIFFFNQSFMIKYSDRFLNYRRIYGYTSCDWWSSGLYDVRAIENILLTLGCQHCQCIGKNGLLSLFYGSPIFASTSAKGWKSRTLLNIYCLYQIEFFNIPTPDVKKYFRC
jgi:hypothetical protein